MLSLIATGVGVGVIASSPFVLDRLAAQNGTLLTKTREGTVQAIMNGNRFSHFVMEYAGHVFQGGNDPVERWNIIEDTRAWNQRLWGTCSRTVNPFGWRYVGLPGARNVYTYEQTWRERNKKQEGGKLILRENETTDFAYVINFPYGMLLPDGEDKDGIPLIVEYIAMVRITNPYKALFLTQDWPQVVEGVLNEIVKDYVGDEKYEDLRKENTGEFKGGRFNNDIIAVQEMIEREYGVRICHAFLLNIDPAPEYREATTIVAMAEIKADAAEAEAREAEIRAKGDAKVVEIAAAAERGRIETVYDAIQKRPQGIRIRNLEALEKFSQGGGTVVVSPDVITPAGAKILGADGKPLGEKS